MTIQEISNVGHTLVQGENMNWRHTSYYYDKDVFTDIKSTASDLFLQVCGVENEYLLTRDNLMPVYYFQLPLSISIFDETGPQQYVDIRVEIIDAHDKVILYDKIGKTDINGSAKFGYSISYDDITRLQNENPKGVASLLLFVITGKIRYAKGFSIYLG